MSIEESCLNDVNGICSSLWAGWLIGVEVEVPDNFHIPLPVGVGAVGGHDMVVNGCWMCLDDIQVENERSHRESSGMIDMGRG